MASFKLGVMFVLWPVLFSIPWAVQGTRNASVGMAVHAGVNAPGFLAGARVRLLVKCRLHLPAADAGFSRGRA
jgi:hypothetical protein